MDSLHLLLVKNQTNLDRLRARARYSSGLIANAEYDTHKQYGPYAEFWDEWYEQVQSIATDVRSDVVATAEFVSELREFVVYSETRTGKNKKLSKTDKKRYAEMDELAREAIVCQHDMLHMADVRIAEHREFTHKLLLVEAIDSLNEE